MWVFIPFGGFVLGAVIGRWPALAAAAPLGLYILVANDLEGNIGIWVAFVLSGLLACAIAAGIALRRLHRRSRLGA
jgi:hypothetical protein